MSLLFDTTQPATNPPDTEAVRLGAQRIRELKDTLETLLAQVFSASTTFKTNAIPGASLTNASVTATQIAANAVITAKLIDGILSADATGRAKMADSFLQLSHMPAGFLTADAAGRAKMADAFITLAKLGSGIFTADTAGRAPFASGFVTQAMLDTSVKQIQAAVTINPTGFTTKAVSTTVSANHATVAGHGLTAAVSTATVQPVVFYVNAVADGAAIGSLVRGQIYFVYVIDANTVSLHTNVTDALAGTNPVTLTTFPASTFMAWHALPYYRINTQVVPLIGGAGTVSGVGTGTSWIGFRVYYDTAFSSTRAYTPTISHGRSDGEITNGPQGNDDYFLKGQTASKIDLMYLTANGGTAAYVTVNGGGNILPDFVGLTCV